LQFQRDFANLVKEQGPTRRDLEAPGPISDRASERALGASAKAVAVVLPIPDVPPVTNTILLA
jgi:hypothetical protein